MDCKRKCSPWSWNFEAREILLDSASEEGMTLKKPGRGSCLLEKDESGKQWRWKLALLPGGPDSAEGTAIRSRYEKERWQYAGFQGGFGYFRKEYNPRWSEALYRLPDEKEAADRVEASFRKTIRLCVIIIAIASVIAAGFAVWAYIAHLNLWQVAFPYGAVVIVCFAPIIKMQGWLEAKGRLREEEKAPPPRSRRRK